MSISPAEGLPAPDVAVIEAESGPATREAIERLYQFANAPMPWWMVAKGLKGDRVSSVVSTYTPTWSNSGAAQPAIGNGTLGGTVMQTGDEVLVEINLAWGGTTTGGDAAGVWRFTLPSTPARTPTGVGYSITAGSGAVNGLAVPIVTGAGIIQPTIPGTGGWSPSVPITPVATDTYTFHVLYARV